MLAKIASCGFLGQGALNSFASLAGSLKGSGLSMLSVAQLSKAHGPKVLLEDAALRIHKGERVGLVGPNGAGKTTLFNMILGHEVPDTGLIEIERGARIGYLPQESAPVGEESVVELAASVDSELTQLLATMRQTVPEDPAHQEAAGRFAELDGFAVEARAKRTLAGLAFRSSDFDQPAHRLSGGWIMRAHLARLLVMEPDLLLLDEPTNHLDLETLGWFQHQIGRFPGALLTISHDRAFLNATCTAIVEIRQRQFHRYVGNFDAFTKEKAARDAQQAAAFKNQQREIAHLESFVERFRAKATKASQAQSRLKQLEKMERIEAPERDAPEIHFTFPQPPRSGQRVATLDNVTQAYGAHTVYRNLNLQIEKGERTVLVGPNGAGKSTLLKIIADLVPLRAGHCELGHNVKSGYFSQQRADVLDLEATVLGAAMEKVSRNLDETAVRTLLGAFLFRGEDVFKKVKVLSGGEKSRLALVKLLLDPPNLLLLDEPTTHLDMGGINALTGALRDYTGTLLFVSHDVHFIRAVANRTIRIEAGKVTRFAGDYDYYLAKSEAKSESAGLVAGLRNHRPEAAGSTDGEKSKESAKERRRRQADERKQTHAQRRRLENRVAALEAGIIALEERQAEVTKRLEDPQTYNNPEKVKDIQLEASNLAASLSEKNEAWERAAAELAGQNSG